MDGRTYVIAVSQDISIYTKSKQAEQANEPSNKHTHTDTRASATPPGKMHFLSDAVKAIDGQLAKWSVPADGQTKQQRNSCKTHTSLSFCLSVCLSFFRWECFASFYNEFLISDLNILLYKF